MKRVGPPKQDPLFKLNKRDDETFFFDENDEEKNDEENDSSESSNEDPNFIKNSNFPHKVMDLSDMDVGGMTQIANGGNKQNNRNYFWKKKLIAEVTKKRQPMYDFARILAAQCHKKMNEIITEFPNDYLEEIAKGSATLQDLVKNLLSDTFNLSDDINKDISLRKSLVKTLMTVVNDYKTSLFEEKTNSLKKISNNHSEYSHESLFKKNRKKKNQFNTIINDMELVNNTINVDDYEDDENYAYGKKIKSESPSTTLNAPTATSTIQPNNNQNSSLNSSLSDEDISDDISNLIQFLNNHERDLQEGNWLASKDTGENVLGILFFKDEILGYMTSVKDEINTICKKDFTLEELITSVSVRTHFAKFIAFEERKTAQNYVNTAHIRLSYGKTEKQIISEQTEKKGFIYFFNNVFSMPVKNYLKNKHQKDKITKHQHELVYISPTEQTNKTLFDQNNQIQIIDPFAYI